MKKDFDLQSQLNDIYATSLRADKRPVVGITTNHENIDATLREAYYQQVVAAGGVPMLIPPVDDTEVIMDTLDHIDALILTGGADYNPLWAGEEPLTGLHHINARRDKAELIITRLAFDRQIPMLGICRGIQTLAMALGGKVTQDITATIKHSQDADRSEVTHSVKISKDSILYKVYGNSTHLLVNSFHHQAVSDPGTHFHTTALSFDNIVEAIESNEHKPIMGVQWHPEWLQEEGLKLFAWLVEQAKVFSKAKALHHRMITLDSHCDTPMFFPLGVHFEQRDPRILVDLHKMTEGHQDATTMVCYLPQPKPGENFEDKIDWGCLEAQKTNSPKAYADLIFSHIQDHIFTPCAPFLRHAGTVSELIANKHQGLKTVMLGIENGLALEGDPANVRYFKEKYGITYITLCHNGDNDICESARKWDGAPAHSWTGVSPLGAEIIAEMNRQGVMVDLSHAAESSFYDALDISKTPIVCSHSNCRALCDHPRNLTDDQLHAIAQKDGVVQITLYHGFLSKDGADSPAESQASIMTAMEHLQHAIGVMGIEHVGLGTDFDGDGGVRGLANSSELINFTQELLRRRYSEHDIALIWGGNWLRVMQQVQNSL